MADIDKNRELSRREIRKKRRIRNQILSYVSLGILLVVVITGVFLTGRYVSGKITDKKQEENLAKEMEAMAQAETETVESESVETIEEYTEEDLLEEMIDACISGMAAEDKIAGLFMTTPEALTGVDAAIKAGSGTEESLTKYPVGGLVYSSKNIKSETQFSEMISDTVSKSKYPLFLILQEENDTLGDDLSKYGINMEFAPGETAGTGAEAAYVTSMLPGVGADVQESVFTAQITGEAEDIASKCITALEGGADLLFVPENFADAYDGVLAAVKEGKLDESRVNESLERIYRIKYRGRLEE